MTEAFMAYPDQRFPNEMKPIHADGCTTVLYQGRKVTLTETRGDDILADPAGRPYRHQWL